VCVCVYRYINDILCNENSILPWSKKFYNVEIFKRELFRINNVLCPKKSNCLPKKVKKKKKIWTLYAAGFRFLVGAYYSSHFISIYTRGGTCNSTILKLSWQFRHILISTENSKVIQSSEYDNTFMSHEILSHNIRNRITFTEEEIWIIPTSVLRTRILISCSWITEFCQIYF
jgi:hypothetical protein